MFLSTICPEIGTQITRQYCKNGIYCSRVVVIGGGRTKCLHTTSMTNKNYQRENFENFLTGAHPGFDNRRATTGGRGVKSPAADEFYGFLKKKHLKLPNYKAHVN